VTVASIYLYILNSRCILIPYGADGNGIATGGSDILL
jgi:hypothetical protein